MKERFVVRRTSLVLEEIHHEGGPIPERPLLHGAVMAVVNNPFAGRYVHELESAMTELKPLGVDLAKRLVAALGGAARVEGYGKGAIVGADGELEHGALWHVPGGYAMREALGDSLAIVPSTKKVGAPGATLDVPLTHRDASYVRSHFDAMEVRCPDAPRREELLVVLAMTTGPRIHSRMGGLRADEISERNGLR